MLLPKRVKHRKQFRGRMRGLAVRGNYLEFGDFGIIAMAPHWVTSRQIEAARIAMTRHIKRGGQVWIRIFPDKPYTKKPLEQRMGKGKAPVEGWVAVVKPGRVMFEMDGVSVDVAKEAMRLAMHKLPMECKFVTLADFENGPPLESGKDHQLQATARKKAIRAARPPRVRKLKIVDDFDTPAAPPAEPELVGASAEETAE